MPLIEYECTVCHTRFDSIEKHPVPDKVTCKSEGCNGEANRQLGMHGYYKINGAHDIKGTPKKFRGGK